jgi:hypothetical protein
MALARPLVSWSNSGMSSDRGLAAYCSTLAVAVGGVASVGVFLRGGDETQLATSARGEQFEMVTAGVYSFNGVQIVAEGVAWDIFTLVATVPALLLSAYWLSRGSFRARLASLGLLVYYFYQYLMYATAWALGPLFLPFVALCGASGIGVAWLSTSLSTSAIAQRFDERFPRRSVVGFCVVIALVLVVMWSGVIVAVQRGEAPLNGQTTLVVQALDLGLVVPLAGMTALMALRRRPVAYVLGSVVAVKGLAMSCAIVLMVLGSANVGDPMDWPGLVIFILAAAYCTWLCARIWRSVLPIE